MPAAAGAAAAAPECFGAAARDPRKPCANEPLSVTPAPDAIDREPGVACQKVRPAPPGCVFGATTSKARSRFALIGDSHVYHWRAALDVVGRIKRWQGVSLMFGGCYFSQAVRYFPAGPREPCAEWNRSVVAWLRAHPDVSTVFVTHNADTPIRPPAGRTERAVKVAGFQRRWKGLPRSVKRVIVLRDNPKSTPDTIRCVARVVAQGTQPPGGACRLRRTVALERDTAVVAAQRLRSQRYRSIDLTPYFCSATHCFPVIGGVLVNRDSFGHITQTFMRTLVPYVLRRLRWLGLRRTT